MKSMDYIKKQLEKFALEVTYLTTIRNEIDYMLTDYNRYLWGEKTNKEICPTIINHLKNLRKRLGGEALEQCKELIKQFKKLGDKVE